MKEIVKLKESKPCMDCGRQYPYSDQKATGTPRQAIRDGADLLVVGRPIRDAQDPQKAAEAILREIEEAG